jgi:hyaluronoglucosaminidase
MAERRALFEFGAPRGMNTYLYAPKDDPYHRRRWRLPYPRSQWRKLIQLIGFAQKIGVDFVYGFHPGEGLCFSARQPIQILLNKAERFYDAGVRTFAVLFDDIPSRLAHARDRRFFAHSLARAEATWLAEIQERQPRSWKNVEWWICPSYYSEDPLLERLFGRFEPHFLDHLGEHLPANVACFWTGPAVVSGRITLNHVQRIAKQLRHPLLLWDNYPVNDLSMKDELHIGPVQDRDPRLPELVYGYLNNPLIQAELSLVPLATCFEYAASPLDYQPARSWRKIIEERFGADAVAPWRTLRQFCERWREAKTAKRSIRLGAQERVRLRAALDYLREQRSQKWTREISPWRRQIEAALKHGAIAR